MYRLSSYPQAAQVNLVVGTFVWVEDPEESWIDGEVVEVNDEDIKISCTSGKTVSFCFPAFHTK